MEHLFRLRRSRLALLVVGVILFEFWRIVQRRKSHVEGIVTDREGPIIFEDWDGLQPWSSQRRESIINDVLDYGDPARRWDEDE